MAIFRLEDRFLKPVVFGTTGLFLLLTVIFFLPVSIPHKLLCSDNMHNAFHGTLAEKQPLRTRSSPVCILRLHSGMAQIRRAGAVQELPCPGNILPCAVAAVRPFHPLPHQELYPPDGVLIIILSYSGIFAAYCDAFYTSWRWTL